MWRLVAKTEFTERQMQRLLELGINLKLLSEVEWKMLSRNSTFYSEQRYTPMTPTAGAPIQLMSVERAARFRPQ